MPVIKSAKKKLRKDKVRTERNDKMRIVFSKALKSAVKKPTAESVKNAITLADKAAKNKLIHKNKASRIKSRLSKLVKPVAKKAIAATSTKTKSSKAKK